MAAYGFRLRFNLHGEDRIAIESDALEFSRVDGGPTVRIVSGAQNKPISAYPRVAITGRPFDSEKAATDAAALFRERLLAWATRRRLAIDLGDGMLRRGLKPEGLAELEKRLGQPVRNEVHGIDVFEIVGDNPPLSAYFDHQSKLTIAESTFLGGLADAIGDPPPFSSAKESLAAELYALARFDPSFRSRFLTLMSALEALLEPAERSKELRDLVKKAQAFVRSLDDAVADEDTRKSIDGSLEFLNRESIGQAGRRLARTLEPRRYLGLEPAEFFRHIYNVRSQLLHTGRPKKPETDLLELANTTSDFLGDLLNELLTRNTGRVPEKHVTIRAIGGHMNPDGSTGVVVPTTEYIRPWKPSP